MDATHARNIKEIIINIIIIIIIVIIITIQDIIIIINYNFITTIIYNLIPPLLQTVPLTDSMDSDLKYSLKLDKLDCYGQMLKDYKYELMTLNSLDLMLQERLTDTLAAVIDFVEKNRTPAKKPKGRDREKKLHRLNIHDIPRDADRWPRFCCCCLRAGGMWVSGGWLNRVVFWGRGGNYLT